jgi:flagellar hook-associated protein 3 FlgL
MNLRVTDNSSGSDSIARINSQRSRLSVLQERISTGKRINRASDDPAGAEAVINLKTTQTQIEQFARSANVASHKLTATDSALSEYENVLIRIKTLVSQGLSDTTTRQSRIALATEIESLRERILSLANTKSGDEYLFGGTRQNAPPFDPTTGSAANTPSEAQYVQIEPGANAIAVGVTAETIFSDADSTIFNDLTAAAAALRGTGDAAADKAALQNTMNRLGVYSGLSDVAHIRVGVNMNVAESTIERLSNDSLSLDERISSIETADFAETAVEFTNAQRVLEATLQVSAGQNRRSLFDFIG